MPSFENIKSSSSGNSGKPEKPESTEKQKEEDSPVKKHGVDEEIEQATKKINEEIEEQRRTGIPDKEVRASAETNIQSINGNNEKLIDEALKRDVLFYNKLNEKWKHGMTAPEIINQIQNNHIAGMQDEFESLPSEKQNFLMKSLGDKLGELSRQIEKTQKRLQDKTIDEPSKQQLENILKDLENQQKAARTRTQAYHLALGSKKTPEFSPTQQPEKRGKEQSSEKIKKGQEHKESASLEIVNHFQEEFKKLEDFPDQKEYQKYNKCNEALNLIKDWLPFGYLDDFQGVTKVLSIMEASKPKTALSFGNVQENTARKITYEMAFQYKMWKMDNTAKTEVIQGFIDKWLKEKSFYYQAGENWEDFWSTKPKGYSQSRAKNGYFFEGKVRGKAKDRFEPDKLWKSFGFSTGNLIKLTGGRDKTLSETCKILAAQGVVYGDLRPLMNSIENQFIKQRTDSQIIDIEEQKDDKKLAIFLKEKKRIGTLPTKPLKIEYFKQLIEEQMINKEIPPKQVELFLNVVANNKEMLKSKEAREVLNAFQTKIEGLSQKQTTKEQSELSPKARKAITKAKEFIKDKEKRKESIWGQAGTVAGWSFFLFFVLFFIGETKTLEKSTGIGTKEKK